jgi:hypothetical protein
MQVKAFSDSAWSQNVYFRAILEPSSKLRLQASDVGTDGTGTVVSHRDGELCDRNAALYPSISNVQRPHVLAVHCHRLTRTA